MKYIDIKELREFGFLQEINRCFLHPLGMALQVIKDENGKETLGGILDYRDNPAGIIFDIKNSEPIIRNIFWENRNRVNRFKKKIETTRMKNLDFVIEPIPCNNEREYDIQKKRSR